MHVLRTRFKKEIVAEFLPPGSHSKNIRHRQDKAIIFCPGMPSAPGKERALEFWSKKGYWTFLPRYRGTWESGGRFLKESPEYDILDIVEQLPKGFTELFAGKKFKLRNPEIYLFGISFGGPAAILASRDPRVKKAVCFSPVTDFRDHLKHGETIDWARKFVRGAFGEAYRFSERDWEKQKRGNFYNPMPHANEIDGGKIMIIHAKDDKSVRYQPVQKFAKLTGASLWLLARGGHAPSAWLSGKRFYNRISKFLR